MHTDIQAPTLAKNKSIYMFNLLEGTLTCPCTFKPKVRDTYMNIFRKGSFKQVNHYFLCDLMSDLMNKEQTDDVSCVCHDSSRS